MNDSHREPCSAHDHEPTTRNPMKRAWMLGVTAAVLAAGTLFGAPAAQPKITCEIKNLSGPGGINVTWPFTTEVIGCTGTTRSNLVTMQDALFAVVTHYHTILAKGPVLQAMKPLVFLFNKPSDFNTYFNFTITNPCASPSNVQGVSVLSGCSGFVAGGKPYTAVFANYVQLDWVTQKYIWVENQYIGLTAAHEMGHWFDRLILGTVSDPYSCSQIWKDEMNVSAGPGAKGDYPTFNNLKFACMGADVFNGLMDDKIPSSYICCCKSNNGQGPDLSSNYTGYATNTDVLNAAVLTGIYQAPQCPQKGPKKSSELFAEETAIITGDVVQDKSVDDYLNRPGEWNCTATLVMSMLAYGAAPGVPPSPVQVPSNCPAK